MKKKEKQKRITGTLADPKVQEELKRQTTAAMQRSIADPTATKLFLGETPDDDVLVEGLTVKEWKFVEAYLGPAFGDATQAAALAGYPDDNRYRLKAQGWALVNRPRVHSAIVMRMHEMFDDPSWTRNRLIQVAASSLANFLTLVPGEDGKPAAAVVDLDKALQAGALGQLKKFDPESGAIETHNPVPALVALAKLQGLWVEKGEMKILGNLEHKVEIRPMMGKLLADPKKFEEAKRFRDEVLNDSNAPGTN